jgi:indolepyruvate ferredoxin oxidoreductase beta subunit
MKSILLVGVGGQGTILASKILTEGLVSAGYDVKMSEIHGMSQRGGNVSTQIRFGEKVFSPIIGKGQAAIVVAFETMEALRWVEYLKPGGKFVINDYEILTLPIQIGFEKYPEGILDTIAGLADTTVFKAADIAQGIGNIKAMNIVMLGALVKAMDLGKINWEDLIRSNVKAELADLNLKAFKAGFESI